MPFTDAQIRALASETLDMDASEFQIDDDAEVDRILDDGAWVTVRIWVDLMDREESEVREKE